MNELYSERGKIGAPCAAGQVNLYERFAPGDGAAAKARPTVAAVLGKEGFA